MGMVDTAPESHDELRDLEGRLQRRAVIEQAKGVLCARHGIDPEAAFEQLKARSRNSNIKVAEVAAEVVQAELTGDCGQYAGERGLMRLLDGMVSSVVVLRGEHGDDGKIVDMVVDYANPVARDIEGRALTDLIGRRLLKAYPWLADCGLWDLYRGVMETGEAYTQPRTAYRAELDGRPVDGDLRLHVLPFGDGRILLTWIDDWPDEAAQPRS